MSLPPISRSTRPRQRTSAHRSSTRDAARSRFCTQDCEPSQRTLGDAVKTPTSASGSGRVSAWLRRREVASDRRAERFSRSEAIRRQYDLGRRSRRRGDAWRATRGRSRGRSGRTVDPVCMGPARSAESRLSRGDISSPNSIPRTMKPNGRASNCCRDTSRRTGARLQSSCASLARTLASSTSSTTRHAITDVVGVQIPFPPLT
jgi:hypothetical protein